jgi:hypothetical protein
MFLGNFFGFGNVPGLAGLVTASQQEHDVLAAAGEINPIAWADVPAQLRHATANAFDVSPMTGCHLLEPKNNSGLGTVVFQPTEPSTEVGRLNQSEWVDCIHLDTFAAQSMNPESRTTPIEETETCRALQACRLAAE